MVKLAINEMTTYRWSFEDDVQQYARAGIEAIGIWRQKLSDYGDDKGIELIEDSGLTVSGVHWAGGFTGSDGRTHRESIADGREAVRVAAALKASCLIVYSGPRAGHTHKHARRLFTHALRELLPEAERQRVVLAIEPMHAGCAQEWTFLTDLKETIELIQDLGSPYLKLAFDTYHLGQCPHNVDCLPKLVPLLGTVHLGDAKRPPQGEPNRCPLGEGVVPLWDILSVLTERGYDGYYEVELMGEDVEEADYQVLIRRSKQTFLDLMSTLHTS
jgi:sugar phosphate isomerase/epimerase